MECRGRPPKSYTEREEWVSVSGDEGQRPKKRPSKCRAGGDLISWRRTLWGPLTKEAQQVQRRWGSNLMAKDRVRPANKGAP
jgi:hypothetical protein